MPLDDFASDVMFRRWSYRVQAKAVVIGKSKDVEDAVASVKMVWALA